MLAGSLSRARIASVQAPPPRRPVAIAIKDGRTGALPRVTANGRGSAAEQILELAFAHGVRVREDADLAEILASVDVDSDIPIEAIVAVAEVLAYVYRVNHQAPGREDG
jgi:flagellar biosynthesis protein